MKRAMHENSDADHAPAKKIKLSSPVDFLVSDTLRLILSKLDLKNQRHARLVCKQWHTIIDISEFSIGALYRDELPSVISVLSRYNKPISVSFKNLGRINPDHWPQLNRLTNLVSFKGSLQGHENALTTLTDLRTLKTDFISASILTQFTKLTNLSCELLAGEVIEPLTQLEDLEILTENSNHIQFNNFTNLKRLTVGAFRLANFKLTRLESLVLPNAVSCECLPVTLTRLDIPTWTYEQVQRFHSQITNLTNLRHINPAAMIRNILPSFPLLERCDSLGNLSVEDRAVWKNLIKLSHLTSLQVHLDDAPSAEDISNLSRLIELEISVSDAVDINILCFSSFVHLTKLVLEDQDDENPSTFENLECLSSLTALRELDFNRPIDVPIADTLTNLTSLRFELRSDQVKHCLTRLTNLKDLFVDFRILDTKLCRSVEGFDTLTRLTGLVMYGHVTDEDWNEITKLTNLKYYTEYDFVGTNLNRLADLTVMRHLTSILLMTGDFSRTNVDYLTALTTLQHLVVPSLEREKLQSIRPKLPFVGCPEDHFRTI